MEVVRSARVDKGRQLFIRVNQAVVRYIHHNGNRLTCTRAALVFKPRQEYVEVEEFYSS
jgi:hypothetical protein